MKYLKIIIITVFLTNSLAYSQKKNTKKSIQPVETNRVIKIRTSEIGDRICYSQSWTNTESEKGFFIFKSYEKKTDFEMIVDCYIEKKVGDKIQIRIAKIESNNSNQYSNPTYKGIQMFEGDILWINPIKDENWIICE